MEIKITKSDLYLIALFLAIAIPITIVSSDYDQGWAEPITDTIIYCFFALGLTYIIVYKLFPIYFPKQQIIKLFLITIPVLMVAGIIELFLYEFSSRGLLIDSETYSNINWSAFWGNFKQIGIYTGGIASSSQNAGILIGMLLGKKFYESQISLQKKEKEKKESELRLLKSQMDPHFLFNNLNTIDSLIDTKPEIAKTYLNKLSQLYRYLIRTKDDEVVPLEEELEFVRNYIFLLEQRYGSAYAFEINSKINLADRLIPPGALQTLLENVVKHNQGQAAEPVLTEIMIKEDVIEVINNLKLKKQKQDSYGVGLTNLTARYKLLSDIPLIMETTDHFKVTLPNLKAVS